MSVLGKILPAGPQRDGEDCQADPRRSSASGSGGQSRPTRHPQRGIWFPAVCGSLSDYFSSAHHQIITAKQSEEKQFGLTNIGLTLLELQLIHRLWKKLIPI